MVDPIFDCGGKRVKSRDVILLTIY